MRGFEMEFLKTRLKGFFGLALLLVWVVGLSSCIFLEYRYPRELIRPTNTIGFQELWSVEVEKKPNYGAILLEDTSLLAVDLDGDGGKELLVTTSKANRLQVVKDGKTVGELHLQVPGEAVLGWSEVVEGTPMARIVSVSPSRRWLASGVDISLVDLRTGEVVKPLAQHSGNRLFLEDMTGDGEEELVVSIWTDEGWVTVALDSSGRELWRVPEQEIFELKYVGDFDGDGEIELITARWTVFDSKGQVSRIEPQDGNRSPIYYVGDLEGDGELELAAGARVYDLKGRKRWGYTLLPTTGTAGALDKDAVVGDADGDGKKEIAFFSRDAEFGSMAKADYWIFLFDAQGNLVWNHMVHCDTLYPAAFADVNGDGKDDLMFFEQLYGHPRILHVYGSEQ
jgi:hypothetical protein